MMFWIPGRDVNRGSAFMLLDIQNLHLEFKTFDGVAKVLAGVNLQLERGDVLALVGETGCGKSMTALSIARLIPPRSGQITQGRILFDGEDILQKNSSKLRRFRAHRLGKRHQFLHALVPVIPVDVALINPEVAKVRQRANAFVVRQLHHAGQPFAV